MENKTTYHVAVSTRDGEFTLSQHSGFVCENYDDAIEEFTKLQNYFEMDRLMLYAYHPDEGFKILL